MRNGSNDRNIGCQYNWEWRLSRFFWKSVEHKESLWVMNHSQKVLLCAKLALNTVYIWFYALLLIIIKPNIGPLLPYMSLDMHFFCCPLVLTQRGTHPVVCTITESYETEQWRQHSRDSINTQRPVKLKSVSYQTRRHTEHIDTETKQLLASLWVTVDYNS